MSLFQDLKNLSASSDIVTDAQAKGIELMIVASKNHTETPNRNAFIAGNMPSARLCSLVSEMKSDRTHDVSPLDLPRVEQPFDELCMDREALR